MHGGRPQGSGEFARIQGLLVESGDCVGPEGEEQVKEHMVLAQVIDQKGMWVVQEEEAV